MRRRARDDFHQLVQRIVGVLVQSVTVGGFNQQHIGFGDCDRITQDHAPRLAQITTGDQLFAVALAIGQPQLGNGRAQNMARILKAQLDRWMRLKLLAIRLGLHQLHDSCHMRQRVQRLPIPSAAIAVTASFGIAMVLGSMLGCALGVTFGLHLLNMCAVAEQHFQQILGRQRAIHRTLEPVGRQLGQQPAVVDMRMGQHHKINTRSIKSKSLAIVLIGLAPALGHAAINQKPAAVGFHQKARPRHRLRCTVKCDVHERLIDGSTWTFNESSTSLSRTPARYRQA